MSLFFPDVNVWLALSAATHIHSAKAWTWLHALPHGSRLVFSRFTQIGMLRLLSTQAVMGEKTLSLKQAWAVYDRWLADTRVDFYPEPRGVDAAFRRATALFGNQRASKLVGDCYLLACAMEMGARLVTFDQTLAAAAKKQDHNAILPGQTR
jgi:toxin-antitoxin system PIN domain toxin